MTEHLNYIAGEWVAGNGFAPNVNPSDLADTIGLYAKGTAQQVCDTAPGEMIGPVVHEMATLTQAPQVL